MLILTLMLVTQTGDTLKVRQIPRPPPPDARIDTLTLGAPTVRIPTGQGTASVWLVRAADTLFIAASIPDTTPYWGDDFVVSLDTRGDAASSPQHDDFQLDFRRVLDSSVVYRGRDGRWQPPRGDPDWRLGAERSGGGWEVSSHGDARGWSVLIRLDPAWLEGEAGRRPRIALRIYDDLPGGWFAWPPARRSGLGATVEDSPAFWGAVTSTVSPLRLPLCKEWDALEPKAGRNHHLSPCASGTWATSSGMAARSVMQQRHLSNRLIPRPFKQNPVQPRE